MTVRTFVEDSRFSIIQPVICDPDTRIIISESISEFKDWVYSPLVQDAPIVAFDTETKGTNLHAEDFRCVGLGLSVGKESFYIDLKDKTAKEITDVFSYIKFLPLIAHNLYFDGKVVAKYLGTVRGNAEFCGPGWLNYQFCTFGLLKQLANEDFEGQQWGLKWAEKHILGWAETNEIEKDRWLVAAGYITEPKKLKRLGTPEKRLAEFEARNKKGNRKLRADQSEMWRTPKEILGRYCALDALACWQLFHYIFEPAFNKIPDQVFIDWHQIDFLTWVRIHIDAYFHGGILIDQPKLTEFTKRLEKEIHAKEMQIRSHPKVSPHIDAYEEKLFDEFLNEMPSKYKKWEKVKEPKKYTKNNKLSKSWFKWHFRYKWLDHGPELSRNWVKRNLKRREIIKGLDPDFRFKFSSPEQLKYLIYECNYKYTVTKEHTEDQPGKIKLVHNNIELDMTDGGSLPTGKAALKAIGDFCDDIDALSILRGQLQFSTGYLNRASLDPNSIVYPDVRIPGTTTGRASSGDDKESTIKSSYKFNHLNPPKVKEILETWLPRPRFNLWTSDIAGLESVVVTEISRDKGMMGVWGPDAKPNDLYIYTASQLGELGKCFLDEGYDPLNPDMELIDILKSKYKKERGIAKVLVLSGNYGASATTMWQSLTINKVDVTLAEVEGYHEAFWKLYGGIKVLEKELRKDYNHKRWFVNATGRPMCVSKRKLKDLVNIMVQSSGHDCLMKALRILYFEIESRGWGPDRFYWFIPDYHDELDVCFYNSISDYSVNKLFNSMQDQLNEELGGLIPIKFKSDKVKSFYEAKKG